MSPFSSPSCANASEGLDAIELASTVTYTGAQTLYIEGNGATITAAAGNMGNLFASTGGGNLEISELTIEGGEQQGIFVDIPASATGKRVITESGVWEVT